MDVTLDAYNKNIEALKANTASTTTTTTIAPVKKKRGKPVCNGRPKGVKNKQKLSMGLSLKKRLKILGDIAMNKNNDPRDVIAACKEISCLLNDRVKETTEGMEETVLSFTDAKNTSKKQEKNIEKNSVENVTNIEKGNTPEPKPVEKTPENSNVSSMELSFSIDSNQKNKKLDYD